MVDFKWNKPIALLSYEMNGDYYSTILNNLHLVDNQRSHMGTFEKAGKSHLSD